MWPFTFSPRFRVAFNCPLASLSATLTLLAFLFLILAPRPTVAPRGNEDWGNTLGFAPSRPPAQISIYPEQKFGIQRWNPDLYPHLGMGISPLEYEIFKALHDVYLQGYDTGKRPPGLDSRKMAQHLDNGYKMLLLSHLKAVADAANAGQQASDLGNPLMIQVDGISLYYTRLLNNDLNPAVVEKRGQDYTIERPEIIRWLRRGSHFVPFDVAIIKGFEKGTDSSFHPVFMTVHNFPVEQFVFLADETQTESIQKLVTWKSRLNRMEAMWFKKRSGIPPGFDANYQLLGEEKLVQFQELFRQATGDERNGVDQSVWSLWKRMEPLMQDISRQYDILPDRHAPKSTSARQGTAFPKHQVEPTQVTHPSSRDSPFNSYDSSDEIAQYFARDNVIHIKASDLIDGSYARSLEAHRKETEAEPTWAASQVASSSRSDIDQQRSPFDAFDVDRSSYPTRSYADDQQGGADQFSQNRRASGSGSSLTQYIDLESEDEHDHSGSQRHYGQASSSSFPGFHQGRGYESSSFPTPQYDHDQASSGFPGFWQDAGQASSSSPGFWQDAGQTSSGFPGFWQDAGQASSSQPSRPPLPGSDPTPPSAGLEGLYRVFNRFRP